MHHPGGFSLKCVPALDRPPVLDGFEHNDLVQFRRFNSQRVVGQNNKVCAFAGRDGALLVFFEMLPGALKG